MESLLEDAIHQSTCILPDNPAGKSAGDFIFLDSVDISEIFGGFIEDVTDLIDGHLFAIFFNFTQGHYTNSEEKY